MQYDDTIRRYNFLAGLGAGALLGLGLALLAAPQKGVLRRRLRGGGARRRGAGEIREMVRRGVTPGKGRQ